MEINASHKLIRYAYFWSDCHRPPDNVSLCRLFWRVVFVTTIWLFLIFVFCIINIMMFMITAPVYMGLMHSILGFCILVYFVQKWIFEAVSNIKDERITFTSWFQENACSTSVSFERLFSPIKQSLFWQMVKSLKAKACPIIKINQWK